MVEAGAVASYADAERSLGLTRARLTQVQNLLLLAPEIQESILCGELDASERRMRTVVSEAEWTEQRRACTPQ